MSTNGMSPHQRAEFERKRADRTRVWMRDHFAMHALPGGMQKYQTPSLIAEYCYHVADAMLAERMKEPR